MAQQINLYTPILLQPRQMFSARTMAAALAGLALALVLACGALLLVQRMRQAGFDETVQRQTAERQQLLAALAGARARSDPTVLAQQLIGAQQEIAALRTQVSAWSQLQLPAGQHHSPVLAEIARTLPAPAWVTALRLAPEQIEISGLTLDPGALQGWIVQLDASPLLGGRSLSGLRVERVGARQPAGQIAADKELPLLASDANAALQLPAWAFRIATTDAGRKAPR
jgi:Tfp pilus assembly protein PilN